MKEISIRELHRRTGGWVREATKYGPIVICDRQRPIAKIVPIEGEPTVNAFDDWKPLKKFAKALDRPVGGVPVEKIIEQDRNR